MTAVFCRAAADRKATTWEGLLARFPRLVTLGGVNFWAVEFTIFIMG